MSDNKANQRVLAHVAAALTEIGKARALINGSPDVAATMQGTALGDLLEAERRLRWCVTKSEAKAERVPGKWPIAPPC